MNTFHRFLAVVAAFLVLAAAGQAQRTRHVNLQQMVQKSGAIVHATVTKIETGRDARTRLLYTDVTLTVKENFYGASGATYTFRQYGGSSRRIHYYPNGMVRYRQGQELVLMLYGKSKMGMQSPVGMKQGVFEVKTDAKTGARTAINGMNNANLFRGMKAPALLAKTSGTAQNPGPLSMDDFAQTIRSMVQQYKTGGQQ